MHLVRISIEGVAGRAPVALSFGTPGALRKWTVLPGGPAGTDTLIPIAASLAPGRIAHLLGPHLRARYACRGGTLRTELSYVREGRDQGALAVNGARWQLTEGRWEPPGAARPRTRDVGAVGVGAAGLRRAAPLGDLVLAYGGSPRPEPSSAVSFEHSDTAYPFRRIASLLDARAGLTDPVAFFERINARAHGCGTARQKQVLARLLRALSGALELGALELATAGAGARHRSPRLGVEHWAARGFSYERAWLHLRAWERSVLCVVADAARHANEAFPRCACPFEQSGVLLLDRPDHFCPAGHLERFLTALDRLFPRVQLIVTLGPAAQDRFPGVLAERRLGPAPEQPNRSTPYKRVLIRPGAQGIPRGGVLLVQVDGTLPNFALMQLSHDLKSQGRRVGLSLGLARVEEPAAVYASCVFTSEASMRRIEALRKRYGGRLTVGGSGVDLEQRLAPEIEAQPPDYSLYPSLGDRAIGFLTRGCPGRCAFCVVPRKEGPVRQVADLDSLIQSRRKKLILLDDNLLAHPRATELLEEMVRRELSVNFNQTLDLRRLGPEHAELLRRLRCSNLAFSRRAYHFSLNDCRSLDAFRHRYGLLRVTSEDHVEFVCMYGYNTSLAEDLERLRFLRSLPRAYVFMQRYQPVPGGPAPDLSRLFDERSDEHLDALVRVVFKENMKNVEHYYRWLCFEYALQRGRVHLGLVDTLFRYNYRHARGAFLQRLRDIAQASAGHGGSAEKLGEHTVSTFRNPKDVMLLDTP